MHVGSGGGIIKIENRVEADKLLNHEEIEVAAKSDNYVDEMLTGEDQELFEEINLGNPDHKHPRDHLMGDDEDDEEGEEEIDRLVDQKMLKYHIQVSLK
jgi:hypothetical protein